ncbi:diguanylate cyclase DgcA [Treponema brennaborense]|uniref:diguanylate cyclase n=1 Tax=Treponema brennaborense (strain DSM 12168 / CIP 105900 / DD5/3) TaxID=906968 RepID=F4LM74_TREBD|nr:diguanylate cyclase DgcA [Treponema brennaborense]AEE17740.1 diguanylate cyclase [Treponema brennaborense DSM 12168]
MRKQTRKTKTVPTNLAAQYEKKIYDLQQLLAISKSLSSVLEYSSLIESILYICMCQMRVLGAGIFVPESLDSDTLFLADNYNGFDLEPEIDYSFSESHPLVGFLGSVNATFTLNDLRVHLPAGTDLSPIASLEPSLIIPLKQQNHVNGILVLGERIDIGDGAGFSEDDKQQILDIAVLASIAINNTILVERSSTDMMTHLKLKYFFYKLLDDKLEAAKKAEMPVAVIMFDIDFFKRFNDTYGHACGDFVLQRVARIIQDGVRGQDLAARYGGEEFVVMLYNTDSNGAYKVGDRIRRVIEESDLVYEDVHMNVTISAGFSVYDPGDEKNAAVTPTQLVELADQALYLSKRNGRNRITFADPAVLKEVHSVSTADAV